ncbi:class I adenylate-forming enzyme family protein [Cumulibacter soli]|uniref:class I adenylate-forming enzyme family protein n=1 Tax=Cumulibacter soli TaxID=2546344 RepID=UPI001067C98A|nr:class I adenylate-forming enzyme family protein [Cumulibacter soli]
MPVLRDHAEIREALTAPGSAFEMEEVEVRGTRVRAWRNAPPSLRAMLESTLDSADRDFQVFNDERMSYGEHFRKAAGLARVLRDDYDIQKGDRVAITMRNLPEWSVAFFAAASLGAIVVPLNAWWTAPELKFAIDDSSPKAHIVDTERLVRLEEVFAELGTVPLVARPSEQVSIPIRDLASIGEATELPPAEIAPDDMATIFYTSGTTGRPKGAFGSNRNICGNVISVGYSAARAALRDGKTLEDLAAPKPPMVSLVCVPLFHGTGCHSVLLGAMQGRATLVLMHKWDPAVALDLIERERVTAMTGVPTMVLQLLSQPDVESRDLSSLTTVGTGGASAPHGLAGRAHALLPGSDIGNGYGLTETSSMTTGTRGSDYAAKPYSVGQAVAICEVKCVDPATEEEVPADEIGELWIRGANVVHGYWNRPEATAAAITDGWLHTGDLARIDEEGFISIVDRAKDMLIRGGENVYCAEVETVIHDHPEVDDCAVIGVPHETLGEEVGAVIQRSPGSSLTSSELQTFLSERMAKFKVPTHIWMREDELPRNAGGKILKADLRREFVPQPSA